MKTHSPILWLALAVGVAQCIPGSNNDIAARGPPGRHDEPQEWHEKDFRKEADKLRAWVPKDWDRRARLSVRDRDGDGYPRPEMDGDDGPSASRYGENDDDEKDDDGSKGGPKGGPKGKKAKKPHDRDDEEEEEDDDDDHPPRPEGYGKERDHDDDEKEDRPAPPHCYPGAPEGEGPDRSSCTEDQLARAETTGQQWQDLDHPDHEERREGGSYLDKRQRYGSGDGPDGDGDGDGPDGDDGDDGGRDGFRNAAGRSTYPVVGGVLGVAAVMAVML